MVDQEECDKQEDDQEMHKVDRCAAETAAGSSGKCLYIPYACMAMLCRKTAGATSAVSSQQCPANSSVSLRKSCSDYQAAITSNHKSIGLLSDSVTLEVGPSVGNSLYFQRLEYRS
jgi:hypothetical protein